MTTRDCAKIPTAFAMKSRDYLVLEQSFSSSAHMSLGKKPWCSNGNGTIVYTIRNASSASKRWTARANKDPFAREARVQGLKSRAAFKLLQINDKYRLFRPGQNILDLGYSPGAWSQVRN